MYFPNFSLEGRAALITGGRRGIGKAIALVFAQAGADIAVADIENADDAVQEIRNLGRRSLAIRVDVRSEADVYSAVDTVVKQLGTIDILVNCASIFMMKSLMKTSEEEWYRTMDINLKGYFLFAKAAAKVMTERRKGVIINIISNAAKQTYATAGAYSVAKAGTAMLTKCLALELVPYNIRVNGLGPGPTRTQLNKDCWEDPKVREEFESQMPFKRFAEPEELSGIALLLASDASSYMTGQTVYSDGGAMLLGSV